LVEFRLRNGFLEGPGLRFRAAIGEAGITQHQQEGDRATPAGSHVLTRILYRADRQKPPACAVPIEPIAPSDAWCDDPQHAAYNRQIRLPFAARHELLWRADEVYDIIGILNWNTGPIVPGRGSAIFLHIARPDYAPTAGCIALALPDLITCLAAGLTRISIFT
jgi:L,D-peptidoglycan transpeptidase YkuD (ErfK/YbiS/YcfS/YnhG family)